MHPQPRGHEQVPQVHRQIVASRIAARGSVVPAVKVAASVSIKVLLPK